MKRKTKVLLITAVCAAFVLLGGFTLKFADRAADYARAERYAQMQAVSQLASSVGAMSDALIKGSYASSPELLAAVSAEIWQSALTATGSMAGLPLWDTELETTRSFINQAGDYAYYIAHHAASGQPLAAEEREAVATLAEKAESLSRALYGVEGELYAGRAAFTAADNVQDAAEVFGGIEQDFGDFTIADYDGALSSDALERREGLRANTAEIGDAKALSLAAAALGCGEAELSADGGYAAEDGTLKISRENGDSVFISRRGGYVVSLTRSAGEGGGITYGEAVEAARLYLESLGYADMEPYYTQTSGGTVYIDFACGENGVRIYPDRISAAVSLADGTVTRVAAGDYIANHKLRAFAAASPDMAELPEGISCEYTGLAVIQSPGLHELYCHEFYCADGEGREFLLYTDAVTGAQRQIRLIDHTDSGEFIV